jgi:HEAT repeat protein
MRTTQFTFWASLLLATAVIAAEPEPRWHGRSARQWAQQLIGDDLRTRWYAAYALGEMGPDAAMAVDALTKILANPSEYEYLRGGSAWALGRIGPGAASSVPLLTEALASHHVSVRRNAAWALGAMGPVGKPAVEQLRKLSKDDDATVRVNATAALWRIQRESEAIMALANTLRDGQPGAYEAAVALGEIGPDAKLALPALLEVQQHGDSDVCRAVARAIGQIQPVPLTK